MFEQAQGALRASVFELGGRGAVASASAMIRPTDQRGLKELSGSW
jgi:hypothetical protein